MAYKISGSTSENSRIIVINKSDWSVESTTSGTLGGFEVGGLVSGKKIIVARNDLGSITAFGNVDPVEVGGDRGVFGGGYITADVNIMDYITISSIGDAADFGDLNYNCRAGVNGSNGGFDRGVFGGGYSNIIDYITISSIGNASDFGDLLVSKLSSISADNGTNDKLVIAGGYVTVSSMEYITLSVFGDAALTGGALISGRYALAGLSNDTDGRGLFVGGCAASAGYPSLNVIDYITISSTSDGSSFGGIGTVRRSHMGGTSNGVNDRGIICQGYNYSGGNIFYSNIDYLTITSLGDSQDFGDMSISGQMPGVTSNKVGERGVSTDGYVSNNIIEYITISSTGNAIDFGDISVTRTFLRGISNA